MPANTTKTKKAKGRDFQDEIHEAVTTGLGIDPEDIKTTSMGESGVDLILSPAAKKKFGWGVECKRQEKVEFWKWWNQCKANALVAHLKPFLVFRRNHTKQERSDTLVVVRLEDFIELQKKANEEKGSIGYD